VGRSMHHTDAQRGSRKGTNHSTTLQANRRHRDRHGFTGDWILDIVSRASPHAHAYADSARVVAHTDTYTNSHANPNNYAHPSTYTYTDTYTHLCTHAYPDAHQDAQPITNTYTYTNTRNTRLPDPHTYTMGSIANTDTHTHLCAHANAYPDAHARPEALTHAYTDTTDTRSLSHTRRHSPRLLRRQETQNLNSRETHIYTGMSRVPTNIRSGTGACTACPSVPANRNRPDTASHTDTDAHASTHPDT
jgi:hypothetical protein